MEIREYVRILRRNAILVVALLLLGAIAGGAYAAFQTPKYRSTAEVYIFTDQATSVSDLSQGSTFTEQMVTNYAHIARTSYVLDPVRSQLNLKQSVRQLAERVTAQAEPDTSVLDVSVTDPSATRARDIANAIASRLATAVDRLSPGARSGGALVKVTPVQPAQAEPEPASPNWLLIMGLASLAGLVLGLVAAVLREALDTRLIDLASLAGPGLPPVIGAITADAAVGRRPLVVLDRPRSIEAEAYRSVRTNLQFLDVDAESNALVVTSSIPGEGKSVTAANLALALADAGERTLLVDADLRRPKVGEYLGIDDSVGLSDVLAGRVRLDDALHSFGPHDLAVLPAGAIPPNPSELLQSRAMVQLLDSLSEQYDVVVIDSPPLLPVSDAAILARLTRGAIVVSALRRVRRPQLTMALTVIDRVEGRVLGILPTMVRRTRAQAYGYDSRERTPTVAAKGTPTSGLVPELATEGHR